MSATVPAARLLGRVPDLISTLAYSSQAARSPELASAPNALADGRGDREEVRLSRGCRTSHASDNSEDCSAASRSSRQCSPRFANLFDPIVPPRINRQRLRVASLGGEERLSGSASTTVDSSDEDGGQGSGINQPSDAMGIARAGNAEEGSKSWQTKEKLDVVSASHLFGKEEKLSDTEGEDSHSSSRAVALKSDANLEEPTAAAIRAWNLFSFAEVKPGDADDAAASSTDEEFETPAAKDASACADRAVGASRSSGKASSPAVMVTSYGNRSSPMRRSGGGKNAAREVNL